MNRYGAEFVGTFWLVLGGCGSAVLAATVADVGIGLLGISSPVERPASMFESFPINARLPRALRHGCESPRGHPCAATELDWRPGEPLEPRHGYVRCR